MRGAISNDRPYRDPIESNLDVETRIGCYRQLKSHSYLGESPSPSRFMDIEDDSPVRGELRRAVVCDNHDDVRLTAA